MRLEVIERTGSSGRFEGEKSGKRERGQQRFFLLGGGVQKRKRTEREQLKNKNLRSRWQRPPVISGKSFSFFVNFRN